MNFFSVDYLFQLSLASQVEMELQTVLSTGSLRGKLYLDHFGRLTEAVVRTTSGHMESQK